MSNEELLQEIVTRIGLMPYSSLQHLASLCEVEMLNRTMPETAYMED